MFTLQILKSIIFIIMITQGVIWTWMYVNTKKKIMIKQTLTGLGGHKSNSW